MTQEMLAVLLDLHTTLNADRVTVRTQEGTRTFAPFELLLVGIDTDAYPPPIGICREVANLSHPFLIAHAKEIYHATVWPLCLDLILREA